MVSTAPWLDEGRKYIGLREIKGSKNSPTIVAWGKSAGIDWWNNDDDAWCAVFVGGILAACGLPTSRSALARSYMTYGRKLDPKHPVVGAIAVFPRGSNPTFGHVGFIVEVGATTVNVLNGNVSDQVKISTFTRASIIGLSWPSGVDLPAGAVVLGRATLSDNGDVLRRSCVGEDVRQLQRDMNVLGYRLKVGGTFDIATEDAVKRFQARRGLLTDGEVGPATKAALKAAVAAKKKELKPLPSSVKSGTVQAAAATIITGTVGAGIEAAQKKAQNLSPDDLAAAVQAGKDVANVVQENQHHLASPGWAGILFFSGAVCIGLLILWLRYRQAGRLPGWLGGKVKDDVPEEAPQEELSQEEDLAA